jgi:SAM-dependent methyltransferase
VQEYGDDLAAVHHQAYGAVALAAADVLLAQLAARHRGGTIVDLGCGSGVLARRVLDAGFRVFGVDVSRSMVDLARVTAPEGTFVCRPLLDVELPPCCAVVATGEVLSYAFDARTSVKTLRGLAGRVSDALAPGGIFVFDVITPGRVRGGRARYFADGDGFVVCIDAAEENSLLDRAITLFRRDGDGDTYRRSDERHVQVVIPPADVKAALHDAGLRVRALRGYGDLRFPSGVTGFLARKPG